MEQSWRLMSIGWEEEEEGRSRSIFRRSKRRMRRARRLTRLRNWRLYAAEADEVVECVSLGLRWIV